jgi:hypothetical protein
MSNTLTSCPLIPHVLSHAPPPHLLPWHSIVLNMPWSAETTGVSSHKITLPDREKIDMNSLLLSLVQYTCTKLALDRVALRSSVLYFSVGKWALLESDALCSLWDGSIRSAQLGLAWIPYVASVARACRIAVVEHWFASHVEQSIVLWPLCSVWHLIVCAGWVHMFCSSLLPRVSSAVGNKEQNRFYRIVSVADSFVCGLFRNVSHNGLCPLFGVF